MSNTQDCETYVDDVSDSKRCKLEEDTTNCITSNMAYLQTPVDDLIETYFRCTDEITLLGFNLTFWECTCQNVSGRRKTDVNTNVERD